MRFIAKAGVLYGVFYRTETWRGDHVFQSASSEVEAIGPFSADTVCHVDTGATCSPPQRLVITVEEGTCSITVKAFAPDGSVAWEAAFEDEGSLEAGGKDRRTSYSRGGEPRRGTTPC